MTQLRHQKSTPLLGADTITILKLHYELTYGLTEANENFQFDAEKHIPPDIIANLEVFKKIFQALCCQIAINLDETGESTSREETKEKQEVEKQTRLQITTPTMTRDDEEMVEETATQKLKSIKKFKLKSFSIWSNNVLRGLKADSFASGELPPGFSPSHCLGHKSAST
jgi:hypothetical protein